MAYWVFITFKAGENGGGVLKVFTFIILNSHFSGLKNVNAIQTKGNNQPELLSRVNYIVTMYGWANSSLLWHI